MRICHHSTSGFLVFLIVCSVLISGCATSPFPLASERPQQCIQLLQDMDAAVQGAAVKDVADVSVRGFPYLRTNRFVSAVNGGLKENRQKRRWVHWMQQLDLEARQKEIQNLPEHVLVPLMVRPDETREALAIRLSVCSQQLLEYDQWQAGFYEALDASVNVPDEYSSWMRIIGLYPFAALPVTFATSHVRATFRDWYAAPLDDLPLEGRLMFYAPGSSTMLSKETLQGVFHEVKRNALGVPQLSDAQQLQLVEALAPLWVQDVSGPADEIGEVVWNRSHVEVDRRHPTVYYYLSHALIKGEPFLQVNYVTWYSDRVGPRAPWMERGHLDGTTVRITLDPYGGVVMVDVMNNCGCYHLFVPRQERVRIPVASRWNAAPFVPQWLPQPFPEQRLALRVNSGWHQVQRLLTVDVPADAVRYALVPYEVLERLPHSDGRTESIFNDRGIAKGSQRIEAFLLFSMGIPEIGSMRQRGHHAIELVGREHFDDPYLLERNFLFK